MSLLQGDKTKKTSPSGHTDNSDWHCVILTLFVQGKVTAPAAHITFGKTNHQYLIRMQIRLSGLKTGN